MAVTFSDGSKFNPKLRHHFDQNSLSRAIDLPGDKRVIRHVDFVYRSSNRREGRATVGLHEK